MFVIIAYDVNVSSSDGKIRLRKIAKECVNYGQRVQNSVFEVNLDYGNFILLKDRINKIMDTDKDSVRYYYLGNNWKNKVEHFGKRQKYESEGVILF